MRSPTTTRLRPAAWAIGGRGVERLPGSGACPAMAADVHFRAMPSIPRSHRAVPSFLSLVLFGLLLAAPVARAQGPVRVWTPPGADSLASWSAQARAAFKANQGDSAGGDNYRAYEYVGLIGRRLLASLAQTSLLQAHALKPILDSLGLVTEVATDPQSPGFALLMVRNPYRFTADAVGFLYWFKGGELRIQGAVFKGGYRPVMRVWWAGKQDYPYQWGIVDQTRDQVLDFTLLRLTPSGNEWGIHQDPDNFPLLGEVGEAAWVDLNRDGTPELVTWTRTPTDSLFTECSDCPRLLTETTFAESHELFELEDQRIIPTPYWTMVMFVRLLTDGQLAQAQKLVRDPARVREAVAAGWNKRVVRHPWTVEYGESGEPWPRRLELRFEGPQGVKRYIVVFGRSGDHWLIENWFEPRPAGSPFPSVTMPPARGAKAPAAKRPVKPAPARAVPKKR